MHELQGLGALEVVLLRPGLTSRAPSLALSGPSGIDPTRCRPRVAALLFSTPCHGFQGRET